MAVGLVKLGNGDFALGADIEGVFVPFQTLTAGRVAQLVQRAENLAELAEAGNENAAALIGEPVKESEAKKASKEGIVTEAEKESPDESGSRAVP